MNANGIWRSGVLAGILVATCAGATATGAAASSTATAPAGKEGDMFVRVSTKDPRYFELSDGRPYVPIGLNVAVAGDMKLLGEWLDKLAANRGNFARIWLSQKLTDVEAVRSGQYDAAQAERIDELLALARKRGIRLKLCIEHFRSITPTNQMWAVKQIHHTGQGGPFANTAAFFDSAAGREQFAGKIAWFAKRFGDRPEVFAWELWNEVNCITGGDWAPWSVAMLAELHRRFPKNLAVQSLGSYDHAGCEKIYQRLVTMEGNDVAQVHRYLDLGAALEACKGPVDVLAADAVRTIQAMKPAGPILLAESGAVEPRHSGPFKLYARDTDGTILHDVLFAPFFAGAAGPGHIWHWDQYVAKNDLWWHFDRFAQAIDGLDPAAEGFAPSMLDHPDCRIYVLTGRRTLLAWCRDKSSTWKSELADGQPPRKLTGLTVPLGPQSEAWKDAAARTFDPWTNRWSPARPAAGAIPLPDFRRSIVIRLDRRPAGS